MSRDGTRYHGAFTADDARLFGHQVDVGQFYSLILTDLLMTVASVDGIVATTNYAVNGRFHSSSSSWTVGQSDASQTVTFCPHHCEMTVTSNPNRYVYVAQQVTVPASGNYKVIVNTVGGSIYDIKAGTSADDGTYLDDTSTDVSYEGAITLPGTTVWITVKKDSNDSYDPLDISFIGVTDAVVVTPTFVTPWPETDLTDIHVINVPNGEASYWIHPRYAPYKLEYDLGTDTFTFSIVPLVSPPALWTGSEWPGVGCYFQGRLWLGSTPAHPQTFWGSKSGLPEDFTAGTGLDDESITVIMAEFGTIEWMSGTKNLLIGTAVGEHIVTSEGGVITPSDHGVEQQSAYGSASMQSVKVGDQVFYTSPDRVKLRSMQYQWSDDNYLSTDLTYFSEHITAAKIRRVAWLQNPANLFICLLQDGTFAVLSYDRSNNIYGWSQHDINGEVIDISVSSKEGTSILSMLVKRVTGEIYFESQALERNRFMDSWDEQFHITPVTTVSGLDHLEGMTVRILTDDAMHPDKVVTSGAVTLDRLASKTLIGVGYTSKLTLLPFEKGAKTGSSTPYWKNFHSFDAHLLTSAHPLVNGDRAAVRHPSTPMGTPEPFTTGKSYISLLGWKNETDITIEQDLPFPLILTGVSGKLKQETL